MNANSERGIFRKLAWDMNQISTQIRRAPGNAVLRICLFQLLCVKGLWRRALTQLQAAAKLDPAALPMAQTYREATRCEVLRADVVAGRQTDWVGIGSDDWKGLGPREWISEAGSHPLLDVRQMRFSD